jgi:Ferritin-like domain
MANEPIPDITLAELDRDGALEEAAARLLPSSRRDFFRRGILGGSALLGILALPADAEGALAKTKSDIAIVNFDVVLEYLQSALYVEAQRLGALRPKTLEWARVVGAHELAHLEALKRMVDRPPSRPTFNFRGVTEHEASFVRTAVAFEDLTAAILKWQALRLDSREILAAAATLHTVETRHAAWIRRIIGVSPVASAFDEPAAQQEMARLITSTKFVASRPRTTGGRRGPRYTG